MRVSRFDPQARAVPLDRSAMTKEYNGAILPRAIEEDTRFIAALKKMGDVPLAAAYEQEAARAEMPERRRYCLDIARELYFLNVRDALRRRNASGPYPNAPQNPASRKFRSLDAGSAQDGYTMGDTLRYWQTARLIEQFELAYANGKLEDAIKTLERIGR